MVAQNSMSADSGKSWMAKFNVQLLEDRVNIDIPVELLSQQGISGFDLQEAKKKWLEAIDKKFNERFVVNFLSRELPLVFNVTFSSHSGYHRVIVNHGVSKVDSHHWSLGMQANIAAHEVGHFVGAYDEYVNGATHNNGIYKGSLMGKNTREGELFPRHMNVLASLISDIFSTEAVVNLRVENKI